MTVRFSSARAAWHDYRSVLHPVSWAQLVGLILAMILVALTESVSFLMLVPMLQTMSGPGLTPQPPTVSLLGSAVTIPLGVLMASFVALVVARSLFQHFRTMAGARLENQVVDRLRQRCFTALMHAEWRLIARQRLSDYSSLIITNVDRIGFGLNQLVNIAALTVTAAACIGAAFILSWRLSLFAVGCGIVVAAAFRGQRRSAVTLGKAQNAAYEDVFAKVQEGLAGIRIAKVFRQEQRHIDQVGAVFQTLRARQLSFMRTASRGRGALNIGGAALLALTIYLGLTAWHVPAVNLLPLVMLLARLIPVLSGLQQSTENLLHAAPSLRDAAAMLREIADHTEPVSNPGLPGLPLDHQLTLTDVGVTYEGRGTPALREAALTIAARTTTVITGPSGAGKSTLADVLMGLIVPDCGTVLVDGTPLTGEARMRWRRSVAYVQQDPFLFNASIRDNLLWASPGSDAAAIDQALHAAAADFVHQFPGGLDTVVGDGGIRLSGGERQRIVLARALLCRPSLLILDEATSALDPENEVAIRQAITRLHGELTVIVLGHRTAMVDAADQLVSVQQGRLSSHPSAAASARAAPIKASVQPPVGALPKG